VPTNAPRLLTPEQRAQLVRVPADLSDREVARYFTFSEADLALIHRRRHPWTPLGFGLQLALLRFPGRALTDLPEVPERVVAFVAEQVGVEPSALARYGEHASTLYEHLDELRRVYGYRTCGRPEVRRLARDLLPLALESDRALPLIETALERLRTDRVIAPGITTVEQVVWTVQRLAGRRTERWLTQPLTEAHRTRLDGLLHADPALRGRTRLSWLREAPEIASARSLRKPDPRRDRRG
jgi:hypothetical protein